MIKLTQEEIDSMSYTDVASLILSESGKKMKIQDLFTKVIKVMQLPESYFESKIADFFGLLSTDQRFVMIDKGFWDLSENHTKKIVIEDEDEELDLTEDEIEEDYDSMDEDEEEINYDDDNTVDDDDEEDDLKDLVIMDEGEESDMM